MQTILGAGGLIGIEVAKALPQYTDHIRLVSRNPQAVNPSDELFSADLTNPAAVDQAVAGSEVVYLTVGLPYKLSVWAYHWPIVMENTIRACLKHQAKLVFFDNIYLYSGDNLNPITEKLPVDPPSKKGKIRAVLVESFWRAVKEEGLQGCIARCADFYGPGKSQNDVLGQAVFAPLSKGQTANWTGGLDYKHAFTYTPDAGKATALLGNSPEAYGQAWHLPTAPNPYTGRELVEKIAAEFGVKAKMRGMNRSMATILGLFIPLLREVKEMMYQYEQDYIFSSDKFEAQFDMKPTPYDEGIQTIIKQDYS